MRRAPLHPTGILISQIIPLSFSLLCLLPSAVRNVIGLCTAAAAAEAAHHEKELLRQA